MNYLKQNSNSSLNFFLIRFFNIKSDIIFESPNVGTNTSMNPLISAYDVYLNHARKKNF